MLRPPRFGIGQVLARLQPEFPELTPSKLRFLEEQGLVTPARTAAGYRKFSPADIERLGVVLSMQRDHYLPLKVIRAHLEAVDRGETPALPGATSGATVRATANRYTRAELMRAADATPKLLDDAIAASLIRAADVLRYDFSERGRKFDSLLTIARIAACEIGLVTPCSRHAFRITWMLVSRSPGGMLAIVVDPPSSVSERTPIRCRTQPT